MKKLESLRNQLVEKVLEVHTNEETAYNTDIIVWENGEISTHNYYGYCSYERESMLIIKMATASKQALIDAAQEGLTDEQREFCQARGWTSIWETNSDNPKQWERFEYSETDEEIYSIVDNAIELKKEMEADI